MRPLSASLYAIAPTHMPDTLTNLLPPDRQRALARDYFLRLYVVILWFITALVLSAALLLVPTYVFLSGNVAIKKEQLANITSVLSSAEKMALLMRLDALEGDATALVALAAAPSASAIIRPMLSIPHPEVALSGFSYTPASKKASGTLSVSGTAATRNALGGYQRALQNSPFALSADVPVSAYARDTNITFTSSILLAP